MTLIQLAIAALPYIHAAAPGQPDAVDIATASAEAVELDTFPPVTGSKLGDVILLEKTAWGESTMRTTRDGKCLEGDHGAALGAWQLQHVPEIIACSPAPAARQWLSMAHYSLHKCATLQPDARLAALFSGNCEHGLAMSRYRLYLAHQTEIAFTQHLKV